MAESLRDRLHEVMHVDRARLIWWAALRSLIVYQVLVTPLLVTGQQTMALPVASGIVLTALADSGEDVGRRWRTMLWTTLWITAGTLLGGLVAGNVAVSVLLGMAVALVAGMAGVLGGRAGLIGVLTLVSFVVFNGVPEAHRGAVAQAVGVLVGGLAITIATVLPHLWDRQSWAKALAPVPRIRERLPAGLDIRDVFVRHGLRLSIVIGIAMLISQLDHSPHDYWIPMTVAWVTKPDQDGTTTRIVERIAGTILGILVAAIFIDGLHASDLAIGIFAGFGLALAVLAVTANYPVAVVGVTVMVVSLFTFDGEPVGQTMVLRIVMTLAAGALAWLAFLILPAQPRVRRRPRSGASSRPPGGD